MRSWRNCGIITRLENSVMPATNIIAFALRKLRFLNSRTSTIEILVGTTPTPRSATRSDGREDGEREDESARQTSPAPAPCRA